MADLKDQTICNKFCFNLEKTASETYARTQTFELYSSFRSDQNLIGILNVHVAHSHVRLGGDIGILHILLCILQNEAVSQDQTVNQQFYTGVLKRLGEDLGRKCHNKWGTQTGFCIMTISCSKAVSLCTVPVAQMYICLTSLNPYTVLSHLFKVALCSS